MRVLRGGVGSVMTQSESTSDEIATQPLTGGDNAAVSSTVTTHRDRDRSRQCMKELFRGDVQVTPLLCMTLYAYISGGGCDPKVCISRGIDVLNDLRELVVDEADVTTHLESKIKYENTTPPSPRLVDTLSHAAVFAIGSFTRYTQTRAAALWCAGCFFLLRMHSIFGSTGRIIITPTHLAESLHAAKWLLSILFFCIDSHGGRCFSDFAMGILAYRLLFRPQSRVDKCIDVALCAADVASGSLATYCILAFRVVYAHELI